MCNIRLPAVCWFVTDSSWREFVFAQVMRIWAQNSEDYDLRRSLVRKSDRGDALLANPRSQTLKPNSQPPKPKTQDPIPNTQTSVHKTQLPEPKPKPENPRSQVPATRVSNPGTRNATPYTLRVVHSGRSTCHAISGRGNLSTRILDG